jgi:hypothetical protein
MGERAPETASGRSPAQNSLAPLGLFLPAQMARVGDRLWPIWPLVSLRRTAGRRRGATGTTTPSFSPQHLALEIA